MCGRFNLHSSPADIRRALGLLFEPCLTGPRYNIGPMQPSLVVRQDDNGARHAASLRWGLMPSWAKDEKMASSLINARGETVAEKPSFRSAFKRRRCLVPMNGYYEWQALGEKRKQPWHIFPRSGELLACAGLWETWKRNASEVVETFCIITTGPNAQISSIHDRMPVVLTQKDWSPWLDPRNHDTDTLKSLLVPADIELAKEPISTYVNNVRNESQECIVPLEFSGANELPFMDVVQECSDKDDAKTL